MANYFWVYRRLNNHLKVDFIINEINLCQSESESKGAPAWESHTGTQLVSAATRLQKKKRHLWSRAPEHNLSTLEMMLASTDAMETGTAPGKPLKPESG